MAPPGAQDPGQGGGFIVKTVQVTMTEGSGGNNNNNNNNNDNNTPAPTTSTTEDSDPFPSSLFESMDTDNAISTVFSAYPTTSSALPESYVPTSEAIPSTLALATPTQTDESAAESTTSTSNASLSTGSNDSDPGVGAKAGIAIGVLAGILGIFLLAFFAFQKRRKQREQQRLEDDEKNNENPFADSAAAVVRQTNGRAPRLSLRPVTQFMPNLGRTGQHPDRRQSRGAMIAMVQNPRSPHPPPSQAMWDRPSTSASDHQANPFGNYAERVPTPIAEEPARSMSVSPATPVDGPNGMAHPPPPPLNNKPLPSVAEAAAAGAAAGAAVGAAGLARKTSIRKDGPAALDLTIPPKLSPVPPSPAGTEYSFNSVAGEGAPGPSASAAAIAAAGGPPQSAVHRVQLDFKPTLEDEMELRAGQLVRLLHEYDDGWALCIRLDRSEQGVVPRTCLSTRPVKPRPPQHGGPRGPPVNPQRGPNQPYGQGPPGGRPRGPNGPMRDPRDPRGPPQGYRPNGPPGGPQGGPPRSDGGYPRPESPMRPGTSQGPRSQSPAPRRPESPAGGPMGPNQRSQSPGPRFQQGRPQSPAGMRSQSPSGAARRQSPPGPGPSQMNQQYRPGPGGPPAGPVGRKPVPGQAY